MTDPLYGLPPEVCDDFDAWAAEHLPPDWLLFVDHDRYPLLFESAWRAGYHRGLASNGKTEEAESEPVANPAKSSLVRIADALERLVELKGAQCES